MQILWDALATVAPPRSSPGFKSIHYMGAGCCPMNHFKQTVPRKLWISQSGTKRKRIKGISAMRETVK